MKSTSTSVSSQPEPASPAVKKASTSWIVTGVLLIIAGIAMIPTVALTAIGLGLILLGIAVITSAFLRVAR